MAKPEAQMEAEWSVFFDVKKLDDGQQKITIEADDDARQNLARRFGIISIEAAQADLTIRNKNKLIIKVEGTLTASITQECIVTGQPVTTQITEEIEGWFADPETIVPITKARRDKAIKEGQEIQMLSEDEDPDHFFNGQIDLGEFAAQHLSLAIPPYPKAEGAEFSGEHLSAGDQATSFDNPFAKLAEWKEKLEKE